MKKADAIAYLKRVIDEKIRHKDYKRVTELAELYRTLYTGEGLGAIIKKMYKIDVPEEQITSIIPPVLKSTQYPFNKVFRVKPVERLIDYDSNSSEDRSTELNRFVATFWGGLSLEEYLQHVLIEYGYIDPNAWIVTEFKPFNAINEKAKPYPFLVLSHEAIDYEIDNGEVNYLIVYQKVDDRDRYTMYLKDETIVFQETENKNDTKIAGRYYNLEEYYPKAGQVPAQRIGYIPDLKTRGRTFVSMFDKIVPFLLKIVKIDYEGDVSLGDLAFPKRYEYVERCKDPDCFKGKTPTGENCKVCGGTGEIGIHRTATDIRTFRMPSDKDEFMDLRGMTFTDFPPVEGLRFQQEVKNALKSQAMSLMFNADIFDKTEVTATATEKNLMRDNLNDAVYPLALNYERTFIKQVQLIAVLTDNDESLIVNLILPKDFKFKSLAELMGDLEAARRAKAAITTISAIEDDINEMLYSERPDELRKIRIKNAINPFYGYTEEMIRVIIAQRETTKHNIVLFANLESIMSELEIENEKPWIYDMAMAKIMDLVKAKVEVYMLLIESEKPEPVKYEMPFNEDE